MRLLTALAFALLLVPAARAQSPVGDWSGALEIGGPEPLRFVLHVAASGDTLATTLDIPQQGAFGLPATRTTLEGDSLHVVYADVGARIDMAVGADSLRGTFAQGPNTLPMTMGRAAPIRRPQTPEGPFPYATEEVTVEAGPGVTLAGTFVRPAGAGPFPAVLLLSGSGAQDRDEALFGHRPFAVLADHLARNGVASLRLDDRGEGGSTGDYAAATVDDLTADARAGLAALAARPGVSRVGVVGHSLGGLIAPRLAPAASFVVMLAAPAVTGAGVLVAQNEGLARASGIDTTAAAAFGQAVGAMLAPLVANPAAPDSVLQAEMETAFNRGLAAVPTAARSRLGLTGGGYAAQRARIVQGVLTPGMRSFIASDPAPALRGLSVPALALYGGLDTQVTVAQNETPMRAALAGKAGSDVVVLSGKNHLFQTATTGAPTEYGQIEETLSPEALDAVTAFVLRAGGR
jgi:dienelactone hydrolase